MLSEREGQAKVRSSLLAMLRQLYEGSRGRLRRTEQQSLTPEGVRQAAASLMNNQLDLAYPATRTRPQPPPGEPALDLEEVFPRPEPAPADVESRRVQEDGFKQLMLSLTGWDNLPSGSVANSRSKSTVSEQSRTRTDTFEFTVSPKSAHYGEVEEGDQTPTFEQLIHIMGQGCEKPVQVLVRQQNVRDHAAFVGVELTSQPTSGPERKVTVRLSTDRCTVRLINIPPMLINHYSQLLGAAADTAITVNFPELEGRAHMTVVLRRDSRREKATDPPVPPVFAQHVESVKRY